MTLSIWWEGGTYIFLVCLTIKYTWRKLCYVFHQSVCRKYVYKLTNCVFLLSGRMGSTPDKGVPDMTCISDIDENGINRNLKIRYQRDEIYVSFFLKWFFPIDFSCVCVWLWCMNHLEIGYKTYHFHFCIWKIHCPSSQWKWFEREDKLINK